MNAEPRQLTGWHVLAIFGGAFAVIIGVNMVLAVSAVRTFPGLETKNSYVVSQSFEADRAAQLALGWDVSASIEGGLLDLKVIQDGQPVKAEVISAVLGRATTTASDEFPTLVFDGTSYKANVAAGSGNWNLRLQMRAEDGTLFRQRVVIHVEG